MEDFSCCKHLMEIDLSFMLGRQEYNVFLQGETRLHGFRPLGKRTTPPNRKGVPWWAEEVAPLEVEAATALGKRQRWTKWKSLLEGKTTKQAFSGEENAKIGSQGWCSNKNYKFGQIIWTKNTKGVLSE